MSYFDTLSGSKIIFLEPLVAALSALLKGRGYRSEKLAISVSVVVLYALHSLTAKGGRKCFVSLASGGCAKATAMFVVHAHGYGLFFYEYYFKPFNPTGAIACIVC